MKITSSTQDTRHSVTLELTDEDVDRLAEVWEHNPLKLTEDPVQTLLRNILGACQVPEAELDPDVDFERGFGVGGVGSRITNAHDKVETLESKVYQALLQAADRVPRTFGLAETWAREKTREILGL